MSPEAIIDEYPGLTLEDVASALIYFRENREEIENLLKEDDDFSDHIDRNGNYELRPAGKLDAQDHPFPS